MIIVNKVFRERMRSARLARCMSQEQIAKRTGYESRASINKIELGHVDVLLSKVTSIAAALNVSPAWLLGLDDTEHIVSEAHPIYKMLAQMSPDQLDRLQEYAEFLLKR